MCNTIVFQIYHRNVGTQVDIERGLSPSGNFNSSLKQTFNSKCVIFISVICFRVIYFTWIIPFFPIYGVLRSNFLLRGRHVQTTDNTFNGEWSIMSDKVCEILYSVLYSVFRYSVLSTYPILLYLPLPGKEYIEV